MGEFKKVCLLVLIGLFLGISIVYVLSAYPIVYPDHELEQAKYDLEMAKRSYEVKDYKWATIQAYYSIYHSGQAMTREKMSIDMKSNSHSVLSDDLTKAAKEGKISLKAVANFNLARWNRVSANYRGDYTKSSAENNIEYAEMFFEEAKRIRDEAVN